ncbi:mechanosensitive ion channel family protein [Agrococcus sp. Marseille-P2731]|uniref:mechanosensitive ion channel family protein n=1 Tax=Agrococcus sp. Marseille-P2731 TaxID=1841862 RepID=UPI000930EF85|nr:mechanosensitive ion channel domain-containing protein [Agrococcus sp. Marseille-P2731]
MPVVDTLLPLGLTIAIAASAAVAAHVALLVATTAAVRHRERRAVVRRRLRAPIAALVLSAALAIAAAATGLQTAIGERWGAVLEHGMRIAAIMASAWLLVRLIGVGADATLARVAAARDARRARKVQTQVLILRRVVGAIVVVIALGVALFTFEAARVVGTSLLASAGVASLVAGLAAQSVLGNVFAGIQLVASDAIRVDDVVVVEGEWGEIEEITLTYVVVRIWDERRLVLPSTYFTTTPFENWSRTSTEVWGSVQIDVDWRVPVEAMREELTRIVEAHELWDGRAQLLQVYDATGGQVRMRALITAADGGSLATLQHAVREGLVTWLREHHEGALPTSRLAVRSE